MSLTLVEIYFPIIKGYKGSFDRDTSPGSKAAVRLLLQEKDVCVPWGLPRHQGLAPLPQLTGLPWPSPMAFDVAKKWLVLFILSSCLLFQMAKEMTTFFFLNTYIHTTSKNSFHWYVFSHWIKMFSLVFEIFFIHFSHISCHKLTLSF